MKTYLMLDICSGLGGASQAMRERQNWKVLTLDNNPDLHPDIVADIREWEYNGPIPDLVWCSPPCTEFSREFMPWCKTGNPPDMSLVIACKKLIDTIKPKYWVIENTKGAINYFEKILGKPRQSINPYFLWGYFPDISHVNRIYSRKEKMSSSNDNGRGKIPYRISNALADAIELTQELPF